MRVASLTELGDADGMYTDERGPNELLVRPFWHSRVWEATVVHESVHASLDLMRNRIAEADNEAAAWKPRYPTSERDYVTR